MDTEPFIIEGQYIKIISEIVYIKKQSQNLNKQTDTKFLFHIHLSIL